MTMHRCRLCVIKSCAVEAALFGWLLLVVTLVAAQVGADHPLVERYAGCERVGEYHSAFDEVARMTGPIVDGGRGPEATGWTNVEGKASLYCYRLPSGRSTLEALRNDEASLKANGFVTQFTCATSNGSCYQARPDRSVGTAPYDFALALDAAPELPRLDGDDIRNYSGENARHLLANASVPTGRVRQHRIRRTRSLQPASCVSWKRATAWMPT